jgi:hypothetical protein
MTSARGTPSIGLVEALEIAKKQAYVAKNRKIGASRPDDK